MGARRNKFIITAESARRTMNIRWSSQGREGLVDLGNTVGEILNTPLIAHATGNACWNAIVSAVLAEIPLL